MIIIITPWIGDIVNLMFYLSVCYSVCLFFLAGGVCGCGCLGFYLLYHCCCCFFMFCGVYIFFKGGSWASHHEVLLLFDKLFSCSLEIISYELTIWNITSGKNNRMEYEEEKLTEGLVLARTRAVDLDGVTKLNFWYVFMKA